MRSHIPNTTESLEPVREGVLDLVWSLWAELGVSGWARRHQGWAIDPEALILFTAGISELDPRLRDECISWCVRNSRYISVARLRNFLRSSSPLLSERWGRFAATVNALGDTVWPNATEPWPTRLSSKASLDDFRRPAAISLRLRGTLGVGARSEILLYFIARANARVTAADLTEVVYFSKRNVEKELEALQKAGVLAVERRRNRLEYTVSQPESLTLFATPRPDFFPRWDAIFTVLGSLLDYVARADSMDPAVAAVEGRQLVRELERIARDAHLPLPASDVPARAVPTSLLRWSGQISEALARADTKSLGWEAPEPIASVDWRVGHARVGNAEGVRSIVSPLLATATDLAVWADTRAAQERVSELIRRLILATTSGLQRIDMPGGEGIQHGGYDGFVVNAASTPFVPDGTSVWEVGVSSDIKRKADGDYEKRSASPIEVDPRETTFVFVTPRRWASRRIWETARKLEGKWRDVRVLDADDLETWLSLAPAAHAWLSGVLGKSWSSVQDLQSYWADWREATSPPLTTEVVLAGREDVAEDIRRRIQERSALIRVQGESADESLACIAAAIEGMDRADLLLARTVVISDPAGWDWAVNSSTSLILIPRFANPNTSPAIRRGHQMLIPVGREEGEPDDVVLPRLRRDAVKSALLRVGVPEPKVDSLASRAHASLTSLRRSLAIDKGLARPAWAHRMEAPSLLPALLAGAWDESKPGDREIIATLADRPYQDYERLLVRWTETADPPVRKVGNIWFLVSTEDAWDLISAQLTPTDLLRFREALLRALSIPDPALDLPPDERWLANVRGFEHPLSDHLRKSLVDSLAVMGARSGEKTFLTGQTGQWHADVIARELFEQANADDTGKLWASLSGVLPLLAEAAPDKFLEAMDVALSRNPSPLVTLFADTGPTSALFVSSPHTGLLWALENLAWSPDYLGLASQHLATLDTLDPGGRLSNRPSGSLRSVFLIWDPQTAAPLAVRLATIDKVRRKLPSVSWHLMLAILPKSHDISVPSHSPRWRIWKELRRERITVGEIHEAVEAVVARLLVDVGVSGARWSDLIRSLSDLRQESIVGAMESIPPEAFADADRELVWNTLRSEISNHRSFANASWALPADLVDRLQHVYEQLTPLDHIERVTWLFTKRPVWLSDDHGDWDKHRKARQDAQVNAVRAVSKQGGLSALQTLAHRVEVPKEVGKAIAQSETAVSEAEWPLVLGLLDVNDSIDRSLALGYVERRFDLEGWKWALPLLKNAAKEWSPEKTAGFLWALRFEPKTWEWAANLGEATERAYWSGVTVYPIGDSSAVQQAAELLVQHGRPADAVQLLGMMLLDKELQVDPSLVIIALEQFLIRSTQGHWSNLAHEVATLLDYLATSDTVDKSRLAHFEWIFLPLLRGLGRPARALNQELTQNPGFFVEVLCTVFRAEGEEPHDTTDEQQTTAMLGYHLLESWCRPPGFRDDGSVDEGILINWVSSARTLAAEKKRTKIADQQIGQVLSHAPKDSDGLWPHRAVRNLVEKINSRDLETGLEVGLSNSRGVTWRDPAAGGEQERVLQAQYLSYAQSLNAEWPRTAGMLRRIARIFAHEARWHDERAEVDAERWS